MCCVHATYLTARKLGQIRMAHSHIWGGSDQLLHGKRRISQFLTYSCLCNLRRYSTTKLSSHTFRERFFVILGTVLVC